MTVRYDYYETPNAPHLPRRKRFHPRVTESRTVSTQEILNEMHLHGGLSASAIVYALSELSHYMSLHLSNGSKVHLDGIGYFSITLDSPDTSEPSEHHAQSISLKTVNFKPEKAFARKVSQALKPVRAEHKTKSRPTTQDEITEKLERHFQDNDYITRSDFQALCHLTRSTAIDRIKKLVEAGTLENKGTTHNPIYVMAKKSNGKG